MTHCHRFTALAIRRLSQTIFLMAILCLPATSALAGIVTAFVSVSGPGLDTMSFNNLGTPSPFNDDVAGTSPNWISINQKAYNAVGYIDMVFAVVDSGGPATEYILTEGVHNGTGIPWTDYHLELGFGVGAGFVTSPPGDGLDFDAPDQNSPYDLAPFTTITVNEDTIDAIDGTILPGSFNVFAFSIDVPNGITEFTIRQYPTTASVPVEEGTWGGIKALYR